MELDDAKAYSNKIKGFHVGFYMNDKFTRVPHDDLGHKYKVRHRKKAFADVKKVVTEIREKREKDRLDKIMETNEKYIRKMKYIQ